MAVVPALALFASPAAAATKKPDLKVRTLTGPAAVAPGAKLTAKLSTQNAGRKKAKASKTVVVLSKDARRSADDKTLATVAVKALKPKKQAKKTLSLTMPVSVAAGSYKLIACADAKRKVKESKEKNNCKAATLGVVTFGGPGGPVITPGGGTPGGGTPTPTPTPTPTRTPTPTPTPPPGDQTAPETTITSGPASTNDLPSATIAFTASEAGSTFQCKLDAGAFGACASPKTYTNLANGKHTFSVRATDKAGNTDASPATTAWAKFPAPPLPPAPKPEPAAPPASGATTVADGTKFLYTGADAIQKQVGNGAIAPKQVAVLRGVVKNVDGSAIPGVRVTVLDHPEYGYTSTRTDDGGYEIAVNGGEDVVLQFEQADYTTLQRTESVPWQDFVRLDDVVMTELAPAKAVDTSANTLQAVTSDPTPADDSDARKATLMFEPGTDATMTLPDGSKQAVNPDMKVAATEYTAGANGQERMPGELPDTSAYTYAVEFSVEQASDKGATDVKFDKPVATYVDNFLKFKAGTAVPAAYYDKEKAAWVPSKNGIVIDIVGRTPSANGDLADLDITGDGTADPGRYAGVGIDDAERRKLAEDYADNASLWRVEVTHFTPWDYNWPYGCKVNCPPPDNDPPPPPYCPECQAAGSIVGVFNQTLGERVKVAGTPFALHYDSSRVPGYKEAYTLKIPVSGGSVSGNLQSIELQVTVAGQEHDFSLPATPNQVKTFTWDGKDAYGRTLEGAQLATVRIGYTYEAVYLEPLEFDASFAQFGGAPVTKNESGGGGNAPTRRTITAWQEWSRPLGTLGAGSDALGGWTVDVHHTYDPQSKTLYMGDGTRVNTEAIRSEIRTVAGFDPLSFVNGGTPATETDLGNVRGIAAGADGSVYIAQTARNKVIRVTPDGNVVDVAGGSFAPAEKDLGDGGPATDAALDGPSDVAVAKDGTVYISDTGNARIRRVSTDGTISTFAGGGDPDTLGDDGPATAASLPAPRGLALTDDGTLYVAESDRDRVRRITPDGRIATAAGGGSPASGVGDGGKAVDASLDRPTDVAVDDAGTLYIADADHGRVRKVDSTGDISTLAGTGSAGSSGDDGPATSAAIGVPTAVAVGREGSVYVADRIHHVVRRIAQDGTIVRYAGNGRSGDSGDGGAPLSAQLSFPQALAVAPDQSLLIGDAGNGRVRRAAVGLPGFTDADFSLPSQDGTELYQFNRNGRHIRTVDALTGTTRYSFGYDAAGRLISITDGDGNLTAITRDATTGEATGIVAAGAGGGRTTALANTSGYLTSITDPTGAATQLGYDADGLLKTFTDPLNKTATFGYNGSGLLTSDTDRADKETTYARTLTDDGAKIVKTGPTGRTTTYETASAPNGDTQTTVTEATGAKTVTVYGSDGTTTITSPDGTKIKAKSGPDPRWGMRAPIPAEVTTTTPGGRTRIVKREANVDLGQPGDPFSVQTLTESLDRNGETDTMTYDGATRTATTQTAGGRTFTTTIDAKGRPVASDPDAGGPVDPTTVHYNAKGKVDVIAQGAQKLTLAYDANHPNRILSRTDAGGHATAFTYDNAERIKTVQMPGGATYTFGYDAAGNRKTITMPKEQGQPVPKVHAYDFDALGRATRYTPPNSGDLVRTFDDEGLSTGFTLPGGGGETLDRAANGRLDGATSPDGTASTYTYAGNTDRLASAVRTGPASRDDETSLGYDGTLLTSKESADGSGTYAKSGFGYDNLLKLSSIDLTAGGDTLHQDLAYDADTLVTQQGPFSFTRDGPAGSIGQISTSDSANDLSLAIGYDNSGLESSRTTTVGGTPIFDTTITRDNSGRIAKKVEKTGNAAAVTYNYSYFPDGRLQSVTGGASETYAYDANGNRSTPAATYTADDQMSSRGAVAYTYDAAGHLATRGADTFDYSDTGELLGANVGGTAVTYAYDAAGRRVSRTQGATTTRFIYGDPRRPLLVTATREGNVLTTYNYDATDKLFALQRGGQRYYVATDQVGTPRAVADSTGQIVARYSYDAYGIKGATTGAFGDLPIGFAGGIEDPLTKLVRFTFRDYEPASGRWTARDPIGQAGGPNTYEYVAGNPVDGRDPMGLDGFWSGLADKVSSFFTNEHTSTALDAVNSVAGDTAIGEAAGTLNDGIGKVQQVQEVLDTALELKEASQEPTDPEQAAGYLKCGLKWIKKILPIDLVGTEAAAEVLDKGMVDARNQRDTGTINAGEARQLAQIEW